MQKTFTPKALTAAERKWYLVDASEKTVGKVSTEIAKLLRGKSKTTFTPHLDMGDNVVVINVEKLRLTGSKEDQKEYIRHTGYMGHINRIPFKVVQAKNPARILRESVAGMIPHNKLKKFIIRKLYIYAGPQHPHAGQNPITLNV